MAPRRGAAPEPVEEEEVPQGTALVFNETLSWRAGKPIATAEVLKRLDALSTELKDMDQEECDKSSLTKVAKELAGQNLLGHKDRGVRALTACCLVDILSLCAPDAPFTPNQLRDIFTLFITSILPVLSDPSNAYNVQHMYVLTSLSEVKSIVLLTDLPSHEPLILHLFTCFFDIISGTSKASTGELVSKNVEYHMNSLLVTLVDEAPSLPSQVIDIIIAQFLRAVALGAGKKQNGEVDSTQSTLMAKELPPAYRMAKFICDQCPEKMARYISQYFNDVILDASGSNDNEPKTQSNRKSNVGVDSDDEESPSGPTEADLKELNKAHRLLRELWRASPNVLQNVIPQLEAELSAENIQLRLLATETLGDIVSGIGAAGPPPLPVMDPAAYPPLRLADSLDQPRSTNVLTTPLSPESFTQTHHSVYQGFVQRKADKSGIIRSGWATAAGRILVTSAGGIGLSREEEQVLVSGLAEKLNDSDEKVRLAAIRAVATFSFGDIIKKLAPHGDVNKSGSVLCNLSDRFKDPKQNVRVESMTLLAKIWGIAAAEIEDGEESVVTALGGIPTKIYDAMYVNNSEITTLMDHVTFEQLVPLSFPTAKSKSTKASNGDSQTANGEEAFDPDRIRTERILTLVKSLDGRSKNAFFKLQERQTSYRSSVSTFLTLCEKYNGGVMDDNAEKIKAAMGSAVAWLTHAAPDKPRATAELWKYAKIHDRRSYALIRFTMAPESDFKTVHKAIKEFIKRIEGNSAAPAGIMDLLLPLIYRCASLIYNKSHLPAILTFSRNDDHGFSATAHEVLKQISEVNPDVFKAQVKELCRLLEEQAPTAKRANDLGSVQTLKACAGYARKYPNEIPTERKFTQALLNFAQFGVPAKAAKYAVSILMSAGTKKEMHAQDLIKKVTSSWEYGSDHFLTQLATMSQISRLSPKVAEDMSEKVMDITSQQILLKTRTPATPNDPKWMPEADWDEECEAKVWALKCVVNRIRAAAEDDDIKEMAAPVYRLLNTLVAKDGELDKKHQTPRHHKSRLRLVGAQLLLKLCATKSSRRVFDELLTAQDFINLACVAQDTQIQVRVGFVDKLRRYLVQGRLPNRFYTIIFLVAFEPEPSFKNSTTTWIKSRHKYFMDLNRRAEEANPGAQVPRILEAIMPRLLSLLAHHPDYSPDSADLLDTARYILYYISAIATSDNIGLIYKYAESVKQAQDAISPDDSERLYVLSDLTLTIIRKWAEKKGWTLQAIAGKPRLWKDLFAALQSHEDAQKIAEKVYLDEEMDGLLDGMMRKVSAGKKKRKVDEDEDGPSTKKARTLPVRPGAIRKPTRPKTAKTPSRPKKARGSSATRESSVPDSERRRSGRAAPAARKSYADRDDSEDDEEMLGGVSKWEYDDGRVESEDNQSEDGSGSEEDEEMAEADDAGEEEASEDEAEVAAADSEVEDDVVEEEEEAEEEDEAEAEPSPPARTPRGGRRGAAPTKSTAAVSPTAKAKGKSLAAKQKPAAKAKVKAVKDAPAPTRSRSSRGK